MCSWLNLHSWHFLSMTVLINIGYDLSVYNLSMMGVKAAAAAAELRASGVFFFFFFFSQWPWMSTCVGCVATQFVSFIPLKYSSSIASVRFSQEVQPHHVLIMSLVATQPRTGWWLTWHHHLVVTQQDQVLGGFSSYTWWSNSFYN